MKPMRLLLVSVVLVTAFLTNVPTEAGILPSEVLVVYNSQHAYSENVALYYAYKRNIPARNLFDVDSPVTSEAVADPSSYRNALGDGLVDKIEQYLLNNFNPYPSNPDYYKANPSVDPIKCVVMCYGVPSRIAYGERTGASIDGTMPLLFQRAPWGNVPLWRYCTGGMGATNRYSETDTDFTAFRLSSGNDSQSSPPTFRKVRFLSPSTAIAVGTYGIIYNGVLSSGQWSWSPVNDEDKQFVAYNCTDIQIVDQQTAFVSTGGTPSTRTDEGGSVLFTQDAGQTWKPVVLATPWGDQHQCGPSVCGISFQRSGAGWVGWTVGWRIRTFTSTDGTSWSQPNDRTSELINNAPGKLGSTFVPCSVAVADSNNVWMCGNTGIFRSLDGGSTWTHQTSGIPANSTIYKVWMRWATDHYEGVAAGYKVDTVHQVTYACVLFTQNGGQTWQEQIANPEIRATMDDIAVYPAQDGSYKVAVTGSGSPKGYLYDSNSGWNVFTGFPWDSVSVSWTGGSDYLLCCQSRPCIQYGTGSAGAVTWTDAVQIPPMHWKLRYMVGRLDALEDPLENVPGFGWMPRDIKRMIDRAVAATPGGKFAIYGDPVSNADFLGQLEAAGISSGNIACSTSIPSVTGQSDVMAYFGPHMIIDAAYQYISWGRPGHTWHPGGVQFYNTNDGQSFRIPLHIWGLNAKTDGLTSGWLKVFGMWASTVYTTHKVVLCTQPGGTPLAGGTVMFASNGTAEIDLSGVTWPPGQGVYVEIRFPDNDQDPDLQGKCIPNGRDYWSASAIPGIISTGKRYKIEAARDVTSQYIREGASGAITAIDEPGLPCGAGAMLDYATGYCWGETALRYLGLGFTSAVMGDPLMAPFAVQPTVSFQSPTPADGSRIRGQVMLSATAAPGGTGNIDRVEFYAVGTDQNPRLIGTDRDAPYFFVWDTSNGFANGAYTIRAIAYQLNTHVGISATLPRTVTLDNSANPTVYISSPDTDNQVISHETPVVATISPSASRVQFWLSWNNTLVYGLEDNSPPYECSVTSAMVPDGAYRVQAVAFDDATGTASYSSLRQLIVHNSGPLYYSVVDAANQPDGTSLMLANRPVTAGTSVAMKSTPSSSANVFYVEDTDRAAGIRVETSVVGSMSNGRLLSIQGILHRGQNDQERYLEATDIWDMGAVEVPKPLGMSNASIGGKAPTGTPGIVDGVGVYNTGLLVTAWGKVAYVGSDFVYLNDGTGSMSSYSMYDGNNLEKARVVPIDGSAIPATDYGVGGLRVYFGDFAKPGIDDYVSVTGISSVEEIGGERVRLLRVRSNCDLTYHDRYVPAKIALGSLVRLDNLQPIEAGTKVRLVDKRVTWNGVINGVHSFWACNLQPDLQINVSLPCYTQLQTNDIVTITGTLMSEPGVPSFTQVDPSTGHIYLGGSSVGAMSLSLPTAASPAETDRSKIGGGPFRAWPGATADEILASESFKKQYSQVGAIGWALSQPDGSVIDLSAEATSGQWYDGRVFGLREWFEPILNGPRLYLYLDKPVRVDGLDRDVTIDIAGATLTTLSSGQRALVRPTAVYAYTNQDGRFAPPLPWLKYLQPATGMRDSSLINSSLDDAWPWKLKVAP